MSSKSFPKRVRFFIADDIRAEGPKPMIIGLFADDSVGVVASPAGQPEPSKETPIVLQSLAILTSLIGCKGTFKSEISLYQPNGTAIFEHQDVQGGITSDQAEDTHNINFIAKFTPFSILEFGKYKFVFKLDDKEYQYNFNINRAHK